MSACGGPAQYEIRVAGVLDDRWAAWFGGLQISGQGEETVICGQVADQPALHQVHGERKHHSHSHRYQHRTGMVARPVKVGDAVPDAARQMRSNTANQGANRA